MSKRKRQNYTNECKEEAVKLITEQGYSYLGYLSPKEFEKMMALKNAA